MELSMGALQAYLLDHYGGRANEQGLFMKLVEEIGEVAEVLNRRTGRKAADGLDFADALGKELADVIHYTVAIAAVNGLDLNEMILQKDKAAAVKYRHDVDLETFLSRR